MSSAAVVIGSLRVKIYWADGRIIMKLHTFMSGICRLGFPIGRILAIFDLQVTPMIPNKFQFNGLLVQENRFSRWQPSWISYQKDFQWFLISFESTGLSVREEWKIDFQDGHHGSHLGFWIQMILAIFDIQVTPMLPSNFWVNWPFN